MSWLHRHKWRLIDAKDGTKRQFGMVQEQVFDSDITFLLYDCRCGALQTDQIAGHWQEQLQKGVA